MLIIPVNGSFQFIKSRTAFMEMMLIFLGKAVRLSIKTRTAF